MTQVNSTFQQRIATLRWLLPLGFGLLALVYELTLARWVHHNYGEAFHFGVEVLFFSTAGPLLAFWALTKIGQWLEEKEEAERHARASERRLASITSVSADAILGLDRQGNNESWNRGAELLFNFSAAEILGQPFSCLFESEAAAEVELHWLDEAVQTEGFVRGHETVCRDVAGRLVNVELTATALADDRGATVGMSVILRDITNRKRREEEIQRLNANLNQQVTARTRELAEKVEELAQANAQLQKLDQMRSEFVSLVSHQLRAPLTNMNGAVQRIGADCPAMNSTCGRMLNILNQQTARLERLVQDVLNTARLEAGELSFHPEPISVFPVLQQIAEQVRARTVDRPISLPVKPGLPLVLADRDRVAEVLVNLLDNADKYSPPGECIVIDIRADQTEVTLSVRDSGGGLPPPDLERVFDKFYRTDNSDAQAAYGYGLGLYVCRRLVEAQGGRIWAENHPQGARSSPSPFLSGRATMPESKILVIDDDEVLLELLADHLSAAGYQPLLAQSGQAGLRVATEAEPDLVVLDVMMPGMDGWEVCRRLREISAVPIIMLTAKGQEVDKLRGFHLGWMIM
ncbi:MAG: hypothetical protein DPW09_01335 [Anaerolineae bacterium]|nr:hypothetical protein [Anaerolineae bacterium]